MSEPEVAALALLAACTLLRLLFSLVAGLLFPLVAGWREGGMVVAVAARAGGACAAAKAGGACVACVACVAGVTGVAAALFSFSS